MKKGVWPCAILLLLMPRAAVSQRGAGDPAVLEAMHQFNEELRSAGKNFALEQTQFYRIGRGRPPARIHQQGTRWVPGDARRLAQGNNLTYLVDQSAGATFSGRSSAETEAAIDSAMTTWNATKCLKKVDIAKRVDPGSDVTVLDSLIPPPFGPGGVGDPFVADIVHGGFLLFPFSVAPALFPGDVLAVTFTAIFLDGSGNPTDIDRDGYLDTAFAETYYNQFLFSIEPPLFVFPVPWGIDVPLAAGFDVETVALHESGHALEIGHFGPPPSALMNPAYNGLRQSPLPIDHAGMCAVWGSWPDS